ncbi:MAG: histidinol-phosphatase [Candidatus Izemoplasma sp.]|nr:histidinol-phosphatase [Candidatus Izemoplasma sp.]
MKYNYHTHHKYCKHATGTTKDYVKKALKHGFTLLGMSDHAPMDWMHDPRRMTTDQYYRYLAEIEQNQAIYKDKITILKGLEIEYFPIDHTIYESFKEDLDFIILGQHYIYYGDDVSTRQSAFALTTKQEIKQYGNIVVKAIKTGFFDIIAHPDVYLHGYKEFDDTAKAVAYQIAEAAKTHRVALEYNANGYRKKQIKTSEGQKKPYPRLEFFKIVKEIGAPTILSSDCHAPKLLYDTYMQKAEEDYKALKLNDIKHL